MTRKLGTRVLCIGNDLINLNLRCARLRELGWEVVSSGNGHDGLRTFSRQTIDAVVLDFNDDGAESALIASQIRKQAPRVPIIMLVRDIDFLVPGATDQADAVVLKSKEDAVLPERIRELLRQM